MLWFVISCLQTDVYLEELTNKIPDFDADTQTDPFLDRPATPLFIPWKSGPDKWTQVNFLHALKPNVSQGTLFSLSANPSSEQEMLVWQEHGTVSFDARPLLQHLPFVSIARSMKVISLTSIWRWRQCSRFCVGRLSNKPLWRSWKTTSWLIYECTRCFSHPWKCETCT